MTLSPLFSSGDCLPFHHWRPAIEDEDRLDAEIEQLADATEESNDMGISKRIALFISYCLEKLIDPDRRVDGEPSLVECFEFNGASARLHDRPKAGDTHREFQEYQVIKLCEEVPVW